MAKLVIRICPNGEVKAETVGIKGKKCADYIPVIEKITDAKVIDSEFTHEYIENNEVITEEEAAEVEI